MPDQAKLLSSEWPLSAQHAFAAAVAMTLSDLGQKAVRMWPIDNTASGLYAALTKQQINVEPIRLPHTKKTGILPPEPGTFQVVCAVEGRQPLSILKGMLAEITGMLRQHGVFLFGVDEPIAADVYLNMGVGWQTLLRRHAITPLPLPETSVREACDNFLRESNAVLETITICRWTETITPRQRLNTIGISALPVPDDLKMRCQRDYERWLKTQYFDLEAPLEIQRECRLQVWRWA